MIIALYDAVFLASASFASAKDVDILTCAFDGTRHQFLPEKVLLAKADDEDFYHVADPFLDCFEAESRKGKIIGNSKKITRVEWEYLVRSRGEQAKVLFTLTHWIKNNKSKLTATFPVYANRYHAAGTCTKSRGTL